MGAEGPKCATRHPDKNSMPEGDEVTRLLSFDSPRTRTSGHRWPVYGCLFLASTVISLDTEAAWSVGRTVRNVRSIGPNGEVTFATVEPMPNPSSCTGTEYLGVIPSNNPKQALAILLTAKATGAVISFNVAEGCDSFGRAHVSDVMLGTP